MRTRWDAGRRINRFVSRVNPATLSAPLRQSNGKTDGIALPMSANSRKLAGVGCYHWRATITHQDCSIQPNPADALRA
jgi:hypothetical protein